MDLFHSGEILIIDQFQICMQFFFEKIEKIGERGHFDFVVVDL